MQIRPLTTALGAEILDVDVRDESHFSAIKEAFAKYSVIVIRDQKITPDEHLNFSRRFGKVNVNRFFKPLDNHPEIATLLKEPDHKSAVGEVWHTDHSYDEIPAMGSLLHAIEVPSMGGDTLFISMAAAYDALSEPYKQMLHGLKAWHTSRHAFGHENQQEEASKTGRLQNPELANQDACHPLVIRHPLSGRNCLYVNPGFTTHVDGFSASESKALLDHLYAHCLTPEFRCRIRWGVGDITIWDNRAAWHKAVNDYHGHRRYMHRVTIEGCALEAGSIIDAYPLIINGKKVSTAKTFDVKNPATGLTFAKAPDASLDDLDSAVSAAKEAFKTWSKKTDAELRASCEAVTAKIGEHAEEIAQLLTLEQGKPLNGVGSRWEMGGCGAWGEYTSALSLPVKVLQDNDEGHVELHRKPLGVVGSITPWNFPALIAIWHIMPALRTGNTVVIKPSPYTPIATLRLVEIMNEVLPPGVVNVVTGADGGSESIGAGMSAHPDIRKIVFTGSCATGEKVMMSAASTMKRLTLEMGGNDAGIVLPDVDPAAIAEGLFWGIFINNGQTCAAMKRLYVHEDIYEEVCTELVNFAKHIPVGDGMLEDSVLGPIQNQMQFNKVSELVEAAKQKGRVLLGGEAGKGLFYPPTIIADLDDSDPLVYEEQFGPAIPVIKYSDIDEVIQRSNNSDNGLGGSVWSSDVEKAKAIALRMECGSVWINSHGMIQPNAPFGGVKKSGIGVEFGEEGLLEYTDAQVIFS